MGKSGLYREGRKGFICFFRRPWVKGEKGHTPADTVPGWAEEMTGDVKPGQHQTSSTARGADEKPANFIYIQGQATPQYLVLSIILISPVNKIMNTSYQQ